MENTNGEEHRLLAETLGEVFLALTAHTSLKAVLDEILCQARRLVNYSAANIMLLEDGLLQVVRWQGYESLGSETLLASLAQPLTSLPLDAQVVQSKCPVVIRDTHQDPRWITMPESAWIRSFIAMPLCLQQRIVGLLRLDGETVGQFSCQDRERLQPLAHAAAIAIENARLYEQMRQELLERKQVEAEIIQRNAELLTLQYAGAAIASSLDLTYVLNTVVREMATLLSVEGCAIWAWQPATHILTLLVEYSPILEKAASGRSQVYTLADFPLAQRVLTERQAQQLSLDTAQILGDPLKAVNSAPAGAVARLPLAHMQMLKVKTLLLLPMEFQGRIIGLAELMSTQAERVFTPSQVALVQLLANQAAGAIENARSYDRVQKELAERRQVERELRQVAVTKEAILTALPDSILYLSREGRLLDFNLPRDDILAPGLWSNLVVGQSLSDILPAALADLARSYIEQTLDTGQMQTFEFRLPGPAGAQDFEARLVVSQPGEVLAIVRDITRYKQAETALRESEAKFRTLAETTPAAIFIHQDDRYRYVNPAAATITGYSQAELLAINSQEVPHPDFRQLIKEWELAGRRGEPVPSQIELKILTKQGEERWLNVTTAPIEYEGQAAVVGTAFDITKRKQVEQILAESEARLLAEMQSVLTISRALVNEINLNKLLELIMAEAGHLTNADGVAVLLLSEDRQWLEVATSSSIERWSSLIAGMRVSVQESLAGLAITSRQIQVSNEASTDKRIKFFKEPGKSVKIYSLLCAPLIAQDQSLGVLEIWHTHERIFSWHDIRLMSLFADQAAQAWHNAHLHARNRQLAIIQERHRLARALHDSVTQSLYSTGLAAQAALKILGQDADSQVQTALEHIHTLSQSALMEIREQLYHLHPTVLNKEDLVETLNQHCYFLTQQYNLAIDFKAGLASSLSLLQRDELYYIAREALWNIVKHANARHVCLTLTSEGDHVVLSVADDGIGFDMTAVTQAETMGLRGMFERAKLLGGVFELHSEPAHGTQLMVRIPA